MERKREVKASLEIKIDDIEIATSGEFMRQVGKPGIFAASQNLQEDRQIIKKDTNMTTVETLGSLSPPLRVKVHISRTIKILNG